MHLAIITTIPRPITSVGFHQGGAVMGVTEVRPIIFTIPVMAKKESVPYNSERQAH
jgi:hypothetical protein